MPMPKPGGIISCEISDIPTLYASYLPFIKNGALFVQSGQPVRLGQDIFVAVHLPESEKRMPLNGKVVWINHRASASRPAGFAVQLGSDAAGQNIKAQIAQLLQSYAGSEKPTFTL